MSRTLWLVKRSLSMEDGQSHNYMNYITNGAAFGMLYVAYQAIHGGYKLIVTNGFGMPTSLLKSSPFTSYFWPAVILIVIIGGTHVVSAITLFKHHRLAAELTAVAGFGLIIWTFTEIYIMKTPHFLQALFFGIGIVTVVFSFLLIRYGGK